MERSKPWVPLYGNGLPPEVDPPASDMLSLFNLEVALRPHSLALQYFNAGWTWTELDRKAEGFSAQLARLGVTRGARVGIILQNVPEFVIAVIAAWKLGAVPVPGNPMYRATELAKMFMDYRPAALVGHADHVGDLEEALSVIGMHAVPIILVAPGADQCRIFGRPDGGHAVRSGTVVDYDDRTAPEPSRDGCAPVRLAADDIGLILYTSGTTGDPKGAVIGHRSLTFNACNAALWFGIDENSRIVGRSPLEFPSRLPRR